MKKQKKVNKKVKEAAQKLLKLFGPKGEHWLNGAEDDGAGNYCLIGGLRHLNYDQSLFDPILPLREEVDRHNLGDEEEYEIIFEDTPEFNDRDGFTPVKAFLTFLSKGIDPSNFYIGEDGKATVTTVVTKKTKRVVKP